MKIADRYILKEFIISFIWSLIGLLVIYVIVDIFEQISTYVDNKASLWNIIQYYLYQTPYLIGTLLSPVSCLLACVISIGNLSRRLELMSLKLAGISPERLFLPMLWIGLLISGIVFVLNETVAPPITQKSLIIRDKNIKKQNEKKLTPNYDVYYSDDNNHFYYIKFINPQEGIITGFTMYELLKSYSVKERLDAKNAVYRNNGWWLYDGSKYVFNDNESNYEVVYFDSMFLKIEEGPRDFVKEVKSELGMGFVEFRNYIKKLQRKGEDITKELVDLNFRISFPFMNLIVILLGFPLAGKVRNIGFIVGFAIALFFSFLYWGISQLVRAYGHAGFLSPLLAGLLPDILFIAIGIVLFYKYRE
ncbi:MAG: LptF/LptG family permease [bacterium]